MQGSPFSAVVKVQDMLAMLGGMASMQQESALVADATGLHMHDLDPSHVGMCRADYPEAAMAAYDPPKERFSMGLDIKKTMQVLQRMPPNADVGMTYEENKIVFEKFKEGKTPGGNVFKVTTHQEITPTENAYKPMTVQAEMEFEIHRNLLKNALADVAVIFDADVPYIVMSVPTKNMVMFESEYKYQHPQFKNRFHGTEVKIMLEMPKNVNIMMEAPDQQAGYPLDIFYKMVDELGKAVTVGKSEDMDELETKLAAGYFDTVHITAKPGQPLHMWYYSSATDKTKSPDERLIVSHYIAGRVTPSK